jgi:hypothetical protein
LIDFRLEHFPFCLVKHQNTQSRVVLVATVTRLLSSAQWY